MNSLAEQTPSGEKRGKFSVLLKPDTLVNIPERTPARSIQVLALVCFGRLLLLADVFVRRVFHSVWLAHKTSSSARI